MSKLYECIEPLRRAGIEREHAMALRRIAMTLDAWHLRECGDEHGRAIERDENTGIPYATFDVGQNGKRGRSRIPDREKGAERRLAQVMANYPGFAWYIQGDPRGAPLYILRPSDIRPGVDIDTYYSSGIAVYK